MSKVTIVFLVFAAAAFAGTSALSQAEKLAVKAAALPLLHECGQELGITEEEIHTAIKNKDIDAMNPCLYSCFFKKIGFIDENNLFNADVAKEKSSKYVSGDDNAKMSEIADNCTAVNDEEVSDENGCDRAKLLLACFAKEKHSFLSA